LNRKRRFLAGLWAGYTAVGASFLFTLLSVPLALHFLPKTEFGLWALVAQMMKMAKAGHPPQASQGKNSALRRLWHEDFWTFRGLKKTFPLFSFEAGRLFVMCRYATV
jgi:hypothetical protein